MHVQVTACRPKMRSESDNQTACKNNAAVSANSESHGFNHEGVWPHHDATTYCCTCNRKILLLQAALHKKARGVPVQKATSDAETEPALPAVNSDGAPSATDLVTDLLGKIERTNRGIDCTGSERDSIDGIIEQVGFSVRRKSFHRSLYRQRQRVPHR